MKPVLLKTTILLFPLLFMSCSVYSLKDSRSLEKFLQNKNLNYQVDNEGDFKILSNGNDIIKDVWIRGQLNYSGSVAVREIFSVSLVISEDELMSLSRVLLLDNIQTRIMGSWSIMIEDKTNSDKRNYLVLYTVKAGLDADDSYILQAVKESAEAAATLEKVLSP